MKIRLGIYLTLMLITSYGCKQDAGASATPPSFKFTTVTVDGVNSGTAYTYVNSIPVIRFSFNAAVKQASVSTGITFKTVDGPAIPFNVSLENNNNTVVIQPATALPAFSKFEVTVSVALLSEQGGKLESGSQITLTTGVDATDKFPTISDDALLTLVQKQTFKYFWDFGHPVSGLARERNTSGDVITSGGSGFGIMAMVVGIHRGFITRAEGLARMQKIVDFLQNKAARFHGAYSHWLNGATGEAIAFSTKDNGADLVETSYLIQGLLTARQYFNDPGAAETALRQDINAIWGAVEWDWFRKNNEEALYWHWSSNYFWDMNMQIKGWNECLITYVLAAASPAHTIPKSVYDIGWASNGGMKNNKTYYGIALPLGPELGGPLFFAHYSFLGLAPKDLTDAYANYWEQNKAHALINYNYCKANPKGNYGYGENCWGLTASDIKDGYTASSPTNDVSVIAPTAALSSFPYTPDESMRALKYFYYKLGDKLWKEYGFVDAFSLKNAWFANSFLAIDQGPTIIMIENHRSGLLWDLFMSCPEVKTGLGKLGFASPRL
jgi:hypothetical protein